MNLEFEATKVFEKNYNSKQRIVVNRGGTRSSKTYSLSQLAVLFLFTGYVGPSVTLTKGVWTVCRKWSNALDGTVIRDFEEVLHEHDLYTLVEHDKTRKKYSVGERIVEFIGIDKEQKVRGAKRDVLHCNEANELTFNDYKQLNRRTLHRVYIDFNPDDEEVWINREIEEKRLPIQGDVDLIVSTYLDNSFLPSQLVYEIELEKDLDPESWKVYGLGQYGKLEGAVFDNWSICNEIPKEATFVGTGLDFGFTNDPTALIEVYKQDGELWVNELIYQTGLTNQDIDKEARELINIRGGCVADSAEPKSITELRRLGWYIEGANKGQDSIKASIDLLKRYKINITSKSVNFIKEIKKYRWAKDKDDKPLNKPIDKDNHLIDAFRYVALNKFRPKSKYVVV